MRLIILMGLALLLAAFPCYAGSEVKLVPHRAIYKVTLDKVRAGSTINNVDGTMIFDWSDVCDGWAIQQKMKMNFSHTQEENVNIDSTVMMWESKDGKRYNFNVRRLMEGQEDENFNGRVQFEEQGGVALYSEPRDKKPVQLSLDTLFPAGHTKMILEMAKAGEKMFSRRVFDGSDEAGFADVSAFIGPVIEDGSQKDMAQEMLSNPLIKGLAWPVRLAFFAPDTETGMPDYEMDLVLQENGIARSMHIDYGDFSVKGELVSLDPPSSSSSCPQ